MSEIQKGSTVHYRGSVWRVLDFVTAAGGQRQASLECLDADGYANVPVDALELEPMTADQVEAAVAARELRMAPRRNQQAIRMLRRRLDQARSKRAELVAKVEEGEGNGADEQLLGLARTALDGLDARIALIEGEIEAREGRQS